MKKLTLKDIEIEVIVDYDDSPIRGNAINSGDITYDRLVENKIIDAVNSGDIWAWASVEVKGTYKGLTASEYLGACSYGSEDDFRSDGYFPDMCETVLSDLNSQIEDIVNSLNS